MNKAIFLDRDGTINIDYGYVYETDKLKFIDGAIEGLKLLSDMGYLLIIITNQSGIGRGYFNNNDYDLFNNYMLSKLESNNIHISKVYTCPHTDSDNCNCRKPKLALFYQAIKEFNIDPSKSYAIGDKLRDLAICEKEHVNGILLAKEDKKYLCKKNLLAAAKYIKTME